MGKFFIVDFDNTCTKPWDGSDNPFQVAFRAHFAELIGKTMGWVTERFQEIQQEITAAPSMYGWERDGIMVAPAMVDSLVAAQVFAQVALRGLEYRIQAWQNQLDELYREHYSKHVVHFREDFLSTMHQLREQQVPFYIVSNADTTIVKERIAELGNDHRWITEYVRGNARKFVITEGPSHVPPQLEFPGLGRPVALRKQHYFDVLNGLRMRHDAAWSDLYVIGDIAELDLALPVRLGAHGCLLRGPFTPPYELEWAQNHGRVGTADSLREALPLH